MNFKILDKVTITATCPMPELRGLTGEVYAWTPGEPNVILKVDAPLPDVCVGLAGHLALLVATEYLEHSEAKRLTASQLRDGTPDAKACDEKLLQQVLDKIEVCLAGRASTGARVYQDVLNSMMLLSDSPLRLRIPQPTLDAVVTDLESRGFTCKYGSYPRSNPPQQPVLNLSW